MFRPTIISLAICCLLLPGCSGDSHADAGKIGKTIGRNVTEFAQGVGTGVDTQMQVSVELSSELTEAGFSHTIAKQNTSLESPQKAISIYMISSQAINRTLIAKAFNEDNQEIGRATADVEFSKDDAQYVSFTFPSEMDRQTVKQYRISFKSATGPSSQ